LKARETLTAFRPDHRIDDEEDVLSVRSSLMSESLLVRAARRSREAAGGVVDDDVAVELFALGAKQARC
jgi:hypothetical protein